MIVILASCSDEVQAPAPPREGIALEAELGTLDGALVAADDSAASGGRYVWEPGDPGREGANGGFVEFKIPVEPGSYALWIRQRGMDSQSDSFRVTWQPADPQDPFSTPNGEDYTFDFSESGSWMWERVLLNRDQNLNRLTVWTFEKAGTTTLRFYNRENGSRLDALFITRRTDATDETQAGVRAPK